jgi:hypothetical protein
MKFDDPNDLRKDFPRFTPEAMEANFKEIDEVFATIDIKGAPLSKALDATVDR